MNINPTGLLAPQIGHVNRLVDSLYINGFALDLSETGTGKTYAAAAIAREMNRPLVVICPKSVIPQWEKILKTFDIKAILINYEKLGRGNTPYMKWNKKLDDPFNPGKGLLKEMPDFNFPRHSLVILDEGHRCKSTTSSNAMMLIALIEQGYKILVSSATVATTPIEMLAVGYLTQMHRLYNFDQFCRVHGAKWLGRFGAMTFDIAIAEAKKAMASLHHYLFKVRKCAARMTVDDFGTLFPESHIVAEAYDLGAMEAKCQAVYDNMEAELARLDERTENYSAHVFAEMMKARREAELCKVPLFVEMVEDLFDEGKSIVVFVNFTDTVEAITSRLDKCKKLKGLIGYIIGGQNEKIRQQDIEDFNADKKRVLIVNISAGGAGISLHDLNGNFPRASIVSPNYSAYQLIQALGRIWRQGGLTKSFQRVVFAAKTIEEKACRMVQFRINNLSSLNDNDLRAGIQLF